MLISQHALEGYNATLFCYGQTGSGKTFTMQGPPEGSKDVNQRGLMQRTFEYIFSRQEEMKRTDPSIQFLNRVSSYVEIYNENIYDLLDPATPACSLREDLKRGGTFVQGATEKTLENAEDAANILETGTRNRTTAETDMYVWDLMNIYRNLRSSRSHSILTLNIQTKTCENEIISVKEARINLVDLAGSERQKLAATTGDRLREGSHINKSLLTLGSCINALVDIANGRTRFLIL
jgi:hypothetical protein